jgi:hypothetical protein
MKTVVNNEINIKGNYVDLMTFTGWVEEVDGHYMTVSKTTKMIDKNGFPEIKNFGNKMIFRLESVQFLYGSNDKLKLEDMQMIDGLVGKNVQVTFAEANFPSLVEIFTD